MVAKGARTEAFLDEVTQRLRTSRAQGEQCASRCRRSRAAVEHRRDLLQPVEAGPNRSNDHAAHQRALEAHARRRRPSDRRPPRTGYGQLAAPVTIEMVAQMNDLTDKAPARAAAWLEANTALLDPLRDARSRALVITSAGPLNAA